MSKRVIIAALVAALATATLAAGVPGPVGASKESGCKPVNGHLTERQGPGPASPPRGDSPAASRAQTASRCSARALATRTPRP